MSIEIQLQLYKTFGFIVANLGFSLWKYAQKCHDRHGYTCLQAVVIVIWSSTWRNVTKRPSQSSLGKLELNEIQGN